MHHARDPIPSCGGGVANLHSTVYAQNPESALPGARACEKEAGRHILYGGGSCRGAVCRQLGSSGLDKSSWTWLITADISSNIPFSKGSGRQGTK